MTIAKWDADIALDVQCDLGESPVWDHRIGTLMFVDIHAGEIYEYDGEDSAVVRGVGFGVGSIVLSGIDGLTVGTETGFAGLSRSGQVLWEAAIPIEHGRRMNDCQVGPDGAIWGGTMPWVVHPDSEPGCLYRFGPDRHTVIVDQDISISNGIGWSFDGTVMFYVDSSTRRVDQFEFDPEAGVARHRRPFASLTEGFPDGLAVDSEGTVWVAAWGAGQIQRYTSDGELIGIVRVPASMPTSCCFGGPELDRLYITSSSSGIAPGQRHRDHSGALFVADVGATGCPVRSFGGLPA